MKYDFTSIMDRRELERAIEVYRRNDVIVISDEIWSDIILDGYHHIPLQMVNEWARQNVIARILHTDVSTVLEMLQQA